MKLLPAVKGHDGALGNGAAVQAADEVEEVVVVAVGGGIAITVVLPPSISKSPAAPNFQASDETVILQLEHELNEWMHIAKEETQWHTLYV